MKILRFKSTTGVTVSFEQASVFHRIAAFLLDFLIYGLSFIIIIFALIAPFESEILLFITYFLYALAPLFFEIITNGQSPGKKILGIVIISNYGKQCSFVEYFTRYILKLAEFSLSFGLLPLISVILSDRGQTVADYFAGTAVVVMKNRSRFSLEEISNIGTLKSHQVTFPEVRRLKEEDIILIKTLLNEDLNSTVKRKLVDKTAIKVAGLLNIDKGKATNQEFLNTLISDYIIATR